jgi:dihydropteroate synthase
MGVVNVTPDSFSDGGRYLDPGAARAQAERLLAEGADVIDLGAESTRPGAPEVPASEQIARLAGVLPWLAGEKGALVSVDTTSAEVAAWALAHGARVVNDVSCLADPDLARVAARGGAALVLMHARGPMSQMAGFSRVPEEAYGDVVADVAREWGAARDRAARAGLARDEIVLDPGLGFWKSAAHSLALVRRLGELVALGHPVLVGPSRKSFLAAPVRAAGGEAPPPAERLGGTIAACLACVDRGAVALRVHDVAQLRQALAVHRAVGGGAATEARRAEVA